MILEALYMVALILSIYGKATDDVTYELYWAGLLLNDISPEQDISRPTRSNFNCCMWFSSFKRYRF